MKPKHSTAFDILTTFVTKILFLGGSFIISVILARLLGPEGKGQVTALFVIPNLTITLANLGIRQASAYYIGQKKYTIQEILSSSLLLWIISSVVSMIIVFAYYLIPSTSNYTVLMMAIGASYVPVKVFIAYMNGILQGQQKITILNVKFIIDLIVHIVLVILLVWVFDFGVVGAAAAKLLTVFAVIYYSIHIVSQSAKFKLKYIKGVPQDLFKKGIIFALAVFVLQLNYKIDIVFLENMVDSYDLGLYSVGVALAELIWQLPAAIAVVLFTRSANSLSDEEAGQRSAKLLRITWIPLIIASIIFWIIAPVFVQIVYGNAYAESGQVIRILLPGIALMVLFKILNANLSGRGKPLFALRIYIVTLIVNIVLNLILIPTYGIYGAAMASTISYTLGAIVFTLAYHKLTSIPYRDLFIINKKDMEIIKEKIQSKMKT